LVVHNSQFSCSSTFFDKPWICQKSNTNDRCYIIGALGYFKDPKAFEPLKTVLAHESEYLRCFAARALAEYGDVGVRPSIFDALKNINRRWWYGTTESIGEIVEVIKKKSIENGRESEFETCLSQMELRHKEMVAEYKKWSDIR
jgi:hypothetical protein